MTEKIDIDKNLTFRKPRSNDATKIHGLVQKSGALDINSQYLYALIGLHHAKTSVVIEVDDKLVGFASAYSIGVHNDILFIWQIAVDENFRKKGLALKMLQEILSRKSSKNIKYIHLTISPSNTSSLKLFQALSKSLNSTIKQKHLFDKNLFSQGHEAENLFIIGPINQLKK